MHTFATTAPITAVLDLPAGRVQFIAADRTDTTVEVAPANPGKARDVRAAEQAGVTYADGVLRITAAPGGRLTGPSGALDVTVKLPAGSRVEGRTVSCELRVVGRLGDVVFDGAYHRVKIDEAASVTLDAVDGDVEIGRLGGPAEIGTARGDIRVAEALGGTVALRTGSGDITVAAAPGVSATLDAGTGRGRITNTLRNDGAPTLALRATTPDGDITATGL